MKSILSFIFVMMAPFLLGGILPVVLAHLGVLHPDGEMVLFFLVYCVIYLGVWDVLLDGGRKLTF
jgi:hypothetical protein